VANSAGVARKEEKVRKARRSDVIEAVLFDFDGTLIDSFGAIAASVNHVRQRRGLAAMSVEEVTKYVGRGATHLLRDTIGVGDPQENLNWYSEHHPSVLATHTKLLPGAEEIIKQLHSRGLILGICSNKPLAFSRELVKILGIAEKLALVCGPEDVGRHKPAPDMLLFAMKKLGVGPDQTLYVGDMVVDIKTARAAGVPVFVIATGTESAETLAAAQPDGMLGKLEEIEGWVEKVGGKGTS
jgi:phosphoglycolate phosphatase